MVKDRIIPGIRVMAFQAGRWETRACMLLIVIRLVTRDTIVLTGGIKERREVRRGRMARRTFERIVGTDQIKPIRYGSVIERGPGPCINRVAFLALCREARPGVLLVIIRLVTRDAVILTRRIEQRRKVGWRRVARSTGQRNMGSHQRTAISYRRMIERCILPGFGVMAFEASCRKTRASMRRIIIGLVTGLAVFFTCWLEERLKGGRGTVARRAIQVVVDADEIEAIR